MPEKETSSGRGIAVTSTMTLAPSVGWGRARPAAAAQGYARLLNHGRTLKMMMLAIIDK